MFINLHLLFKCSDLRVLYSLLDFVLTFEGKSSSSRLDSAALLYFKLNGIRSLQIKSFKSFGGGNPKYK